jgi:hypothetical protein
MSGAPIMIGTNQLPNPPMIAGMTRKNTMIRPCAVISTFHRCSCWSKLALGVPNNRGEVPRYWIPGWASSSRIMPEMAPPTIPAKDREDQIERADVLVIGGHEPAGEEARLVVIMRMVVGMIGVSLKSVGSGGHGRRTFVR